MSTPPGRGGVVEHTLPITHFGVAFITVAVLLLFVQ